MPHDKRTHSTAPSATAPTGPVRIHPVDYRAAQDAADVCAMLDLYARDPMGGGDALDADVLGRLCADLASRADAFSFLAYVDTPHVKAIGLINCFEGYSTFKARPLLNIHDIVVHPDYRGAGVGQALLGAAHDLARARLLQAHAGGAQRQCACHSQLRALWVCQLPARSGGGAGGVDAKVALKKTPALIGFQPWVAD